MLRCESLLAALVVAPLALGGCASSTRLLTNDKPSDTVKAKR